MRRTRVARGADPAHCGLPLGEEVWLSEMYCPCGYPGVAGCGLTEMFYPLRFLFPFSYNVLSYCSVRKGYSHGEASHEDEKAGYTARLATTG